jgi:amino acid adenylation domain-containing protein/non-ribosomal peptide synthase protein (TIGR01720 family)
MMRDELYNDRRAVAANQNVKEKKYWLEKLSGYPVNSHFPGDYRKIPGKERRMDRLEFSLSREEFLRLKQLSNDSDVRLYMILVATLTVLLGKYTGSTDIIAAAPIYRQDTREDFVNQVVILRNCYREHMTFKELLLEVRKTIVEAIENYSYPVEILMKELNIPFSQDSGVSLLDTVILLENIHDKSYLEPIKSYVNIIFSFSNDNGTLDCSIEYNSLLYKETTLKRIVGHFKNILGEILFVSIDTPVFDIGVLTGEEKRGLLFGFNATEVEYPKEKTLHGLFAEQVEKTPDHMALVGPELQLPGYKTPITGDNPVSLTYRELEEKSAGLAQVLRQKGVEAGVIVGLMPERSTAMILGILGILKAGGAYLPIDNEYPQDRIDFMVRDSNIGILVTGELLLETLQGTPAALPAQPAPLVHPQHPAYIIYTSGTTGKPKGVMVEHRNVVRLFFNQGFQFDFHHRDVWTMFHSHCFDFSVWEMYGALLFGGKLLVIPKMVARDPRRFLRVLKDHSVTVLNQTPSAFYNLVREELAGESAGLCLRMIIFGGEALQPGRLKGWRERYPHHKLINMFGITETTVHVTYKEIGEEEIHYNISNIGKPIPTLNTYIFDKHGHVLPIGAIGELCVGGAGVARGYLNRPELTLEKFAENPYKKGERIYRSGDLARIYDNGDMEYHGRIDHQVQLRGFRIELAEIESRLLEHPGIGEAVVLKRTDDEDEGYLCGYVVSKEELSVPELREHLGRSLPDYMIPSYFVRLEKIPLTANGKLDKNSLPLPKAASSTRYTAPRSESERIMAKLWGEVLGLEKISITDSYFDLGGDSIKAIKLLSRINHQLKVNLGVVDLFTHETIEKLAKRLAQEQINDIGAEAKQVLKEMEELKNSILSGNTLSEDIEDLYPMADIQKGMVFHSLKERQRAVYHDQMVHLRRYVDFDARRFEKALTLMVEKHPILRTSFNTADFAEPLLIVHRKCLIDMRHEDISSLDTHRQEAYIRGFIEEDRQHPFDIARAPLWRMRTFGLDKDNIVVAWICHHAIIDGWSDASFKTELNNIYLELKTNPGFTPLKLKSSYKDFIVDQVVRKRKEETRTYWKNELQDYKRFQFPPAPGPRNETVKMKHYRQALGIPLLEKLQAAAAAYRSNLKHVCFAAYVYMLGMLSYENDIVTGVVRNNRPVSEDSEKVLGCFLNTVPLRVKIPPRTTWADWLHLVEQKLVELATHDRLSLYEIAKMTGNEARDQNPIFDMLFNFIDFHVYDELKEANIDENAADPGKNRFSFEGSTLTNTLFNFDIDITGGALVAAVTYSEALLGDKFIPVLFRYFVAVLNRFNDEPGGIASKESLLLEEEKQTLLYLFNRTGTENSGPRTIHELFREQVEEKPDNIALAGAVTEAFPDPLPLFLTYRELHEKSDQMAVLLQEKGSKAGDIVGMAAGGSIAMIIGILGILKAGGAYLPIDLHYPRERIDYMFRDSKVKILLAESAIPQVAEVAGPAVEIIDIANSLPSPAVISPLTPVKPADPAYIIYTSGSSGKPKGVMAEHRNVARLVKNCNYIHWQEDQRLLMTGSFVFDITTFEIWGPLLNGLGLYVVSKDIIMNPGKLREVVAKSRISVMHLIPQLFYQLLEYDDAIFAGLDYFLVGGDMVNPVPINRLRNRYPGLKIIHAYGPTENTTFSTTFPVDNDYAERLPIGKPIGNSMVVILDKYDQLQPVGVVGELYVGGNGVTRGYLNNPELTAEKFCLRRPGGVLFKKTTPPGPPGKNFSSDQSLVRDQYLPEGHPLLRVKRQEPGAKFYKTGDLGRWLEDGNIEFLGRIDSQLKIRGHRIEIGEIESRLAEYKEITTAVVTAREDKTGQKYLCAYFTSGTPRDVNQLRSYLSTRLPDYMIPNHFLQLERMPLTPNGKIDLKAFPGPETGNTGSYLPPVTEIEKTLTQICAEVLGVEKVSLNHNFFELGGDSIKAIQVSTRLRKYRLALDVRDLLRGIDIKALSQQVKPIDREIHQGIVQGEVKLTPIQMRFFENAFTHLHHFNHSLVLAREEGFNPVIVKEVLAKLVEHHDALRMVYERQGEIVRQYNRGLEGKLLDYEFIDLSNRENPEREIEHRAAALQERIDLKTGPLFKVGHFRITNGDYLLLILHHLVVDGVSWRILLEDFETGYRSRQKGQASEFQDKTDSFRCWSDKLTEYAVSKTLLAELPFWQAMEESKVARLPRDHEIEADKRKNKYRETVVMNLDEEETEKLLKEVNTAYNTEINDLLLTALGLAAAAWSGNREILISLEGHGREEILAGVNISRTVGWFTTEYPVLLRMNRTEDPGSTIKHVKETLRAIPNKGIGYGILKSLTPPEKKGGVKLQRIPEISFNYLGEFGWGHLDEKEKALFTLSGISGSPNQSPELETPFALQINGITREGVLSFSFGYNRHEYNRERIETLVKLYKTTLLHLIDHCCQKKERQLTPSDYGRSDIEIDVLEDLEKELEEID